MPDLSTTQAPAAAADPIGSRSVVTAGVGSVAPGFPSSSSSTSGGAGIDADSRQPADNSSSGLASSGRLSEPAAGDGISPGGAAAGKLVPYPMLPTVLSGGIEADKARQTTAYPPAPAPAPPPAPPADSPKVALTLLLLSGQRRLVRFDPQTTISRVKELVWASWPTEWIAAGDRVPDGPGWIRVLYRGRMLDDERTLAGEGLGVLPGGRSTIVHLSIRTFAIEPAEDGKDGKAAADDGPIRPALHTRASSRLRSLVGAGTTDGPETVGANGPAAINGGAPAVGLLSAAAAGGGARAGTGAGGRQERRSNRQRSQSNATNSTSDTHAGSSDCGCVIA